MKIVGNDKRQEDRPLVEQPGRKFVSVQASVHNQPNQERHLYSRANFKLNRTAALAEWRGLGVE